MRSKALACLLLLTLAACRNTNQKRIAVIPKGTSHLFWVSVREGALAAGKQFHVEILWNGPPQETDYGRQIQIVDSMIAQRVDGIALAAAERKALVQPVERAASLGIPVTVFDSGVDTDKYMSYLATDNYEAGKIGGRELGHLMGGKGVAAIVMHAPGSNSTMDRERGFDDEMRDEFPDIQVIARQYGMSDPAKSRSAAENILSAHPELGGVFASAEPGSVGTALAIKSRHLAGKVKFVAFDASDTMIEDLSAGAIGAIVVQDPYKMGFEAVATLVQKLTGGQPPKRIDLHARLIRREDIGKPEVRDLLRLGAGAK